MNLKKCVLAVLAAAFVSHSVAASETPQTSPLRNSDVPRSKLLAPAGKLPFSLEELAVYFADVLETRPETLHRKCVVFTRDEPSGFRDFHETLIVVVAGVEQNLSVTVLTNADYGMNYFRDFIESRFFFPEESEQFYYLLHEAPGSQWVEMFRFRVQLNIMETADWEIVGLTFSPRSLRPLD